MTRFKRLKAEAKAASVKRGHVMGRFTPLQVAGYAISRCDVCGAGAYVGLRSIDFVGSAIEFDCTEKRYGEWEN